jgi:dTDP-4-dehydrorhamnose reductase
MVVGTVAKVAVIGADGQLGIELVEVFGKAAVTLTKKDIDVTDVSTFGVLMHAKPDVIINTAAHVNVDLAEKEADQAFKVNAVGAYNVARFANEIGAVCMYISTDYVFDGKKGSPYAESDVPNPLSIYGASKYAGEILTRNYSPNHYIIRLAALFGKAGASGKGGNFVETIISKAKNREELKVVDDMISSFTYAKDAAASIKRLVDLKPEYGAYHAANSGWCSLNEFARKFLGYLKLNAEVKKIKSEELGRPAKRPMNSALKNEKLERLGIKMPGWEDALKRYLIEKGHMR